MSSGGQSSFSFCSLVDWALVGMAVVDHVDVSRQDPDAFHWRKENLRLRFFNSFHFFAPSSSLHIETINVDSILWTLLKVILGFVRKNSEGEVDLIDGHGVFSCKVLFGSSQERLSEEET